jgi:hypothetical protein
MKSSEKQNLDRTLESAIVVSWTDLVRDAQTGLIQIEYGFVPAGTLDYLKVWSSLTRGHWLLACEYWMSETTFHSAGIRFDNGYESEGLGQILELVMRRQGEFELPVNLGRQGLLQVTTPTPEDRSAAKELVHEAFDRLGSPFAEPALA